MKSNILLWALAFIALLFLSVAFTWRGASPPATHPRPKQHARATQGDSKRALELPQREEVRATPDVGGLDEDKKLLEELDGLMEEELFPRRWERLRAIAKSAQNPVFQSALVLAMSAAAPDSQQLWAELANLFRAAQPQALPFVGQQIASIDPAGYVGLLAEKLAGGGDEQSLLMAVRELERIADHMPELSGAVRSTLAEPGLASHSRETRKASAEALGRVGAPSALGRLSEAAQLDESREVRSAAQESIDSIVARLEQFPPESR